MRPAAIALMLVGALAFGFGIAAVTSPSERTRVRTTETLAASPLSREELDAWKRELLAEIRALASVQSEPGAPREPAARDGVERALAALERRLTELEAQSLRGTSLGVVPSTGAWRDARGAGYASIAEIVELCSAALNRDDFGGSIQAALQARFYLWTPADVFQLYGPPRRVTHDHGLSIYYASFEVQPPESAKPEWCEIRFHFADGFFDEVGPFCDDEPR